jgi:hypothetical protein
MLCERVKGPSLELLQGYYHRYKNAHIDQISLAVIEPEPY